MYTLVSHLVVFGYLGPDTIMPLASILAALLGILMFGWRYIINFLKKAFHKGGVPVEETIANSDDVTSFEGEEVEQ